VSQAKEIIENQDLIEALKQLMWQASDAIMQVYRSDDFGAETKGDDSPVTKADLAAHHILVDGLKILTPNIPVVSEEDSSSLNVPKTNSTYWLIDPLDGTKEFIKRNDEFTCNLALIENNTPVLGFVGLPAMDELYVGSNSLPATKQLRSGETNPIHHQPSPNGVTRVVASKSHLNEETQAFINAIKCEIELVQAGSSLKFLKIATGEADIYPRLAPTCEWDTAAAQAVLEGAGGHVTNADGTDMRYGKDEILNPHFIACAREC
jgi:3'(2'), 5'-bisphosphate nucleotidase